MPSRGQEQPEGLSGWKDVETSPQFRQVVDALRANGPFNDDARNFLDAAILPQLENVANLAMLDDTRKKIRDKFINSIGDPAAFEDASTLVRDRMGELVRNPKVHPFVQVQAVMLVGDLVDKARLPWTPALEMLARTAEDSSIPPGPRAAAMVGIANHVNALNRLPSEQSNTVTETFTRVMIGLLNSPIPPAEERADATRPVEVVWMAAKGLSMLPATTPDMAAALVKTIDDASWPIDVRVRAAAALGRTADRGSRVDVPRAVSAIRKLAITALEEDRADAKRRAERHSPPDEDLIEKEIRESVCRRAAWRLSTLGEAIDSTKTKGGLASLLDKDAKETRTLATDLKRLGEAIDGFPVGRNLVVALNELDPAGIEKRSAESARPAGAGPKPSTPAETRVQQPDGEAPADDKPATEPSPDPFG